MKKLKGNSILILTALIWGFAFVAQRIGMQFIGPFLYNGIRFFLGACSLLPFVIYNIRKDRSNVNSPKKFLIPGLISGLILFFAASFQQVGIVHTTAGKAGFITGLYIIIVPFIGLFLKHKIYFNNWIGALLATFGLYLLSGIDNLKLMQGDFLVMVCAVFWAVHILVIGHFSPKMDSILLACTQFFVCSFLSIIVALFYEPVVFSNIYNAALPILYGGFLSIGIAYTLQVVAQKTRPAKDVSIILSLEAVFAAFGGWMILGEKLAVSGFIGCCLMLAGIIVSQISFSPEGNKNSTIL